MRRLFFTFSLCFLLQGHNSLAVDRTSEATAALSRAKHELVILSQKGGSFQQTAEEMLRLVTSAENQGALRYPALVGYNRPDGAGAEFGSVSDGWRITGTYEVTPVALSTSVLVGKSISVSVHVIFPDEVEAFGIKGREFSASLIPLAESLGGLLWLRTPDMFSIEEEYQIEERRSYDLSETGKLDWKNSAHYKVESSGCMIVMTTDT